MPKLTSAIDPSSPAFKALESTNRRLRDELAERVAITARGGSDKSRERHILDRVQIGDCLLYTSDAADE